MRYKKDPWYIAGLIITAIAVIIFVTTMVLMYLENDGAIIWCFVSMVVLTIGLLLSQSVKRRYEEAEVSNGEPLPMFWRIRFGYHNLKVLVITKGLWRVIFAGLTAGFLATTLVLGVLCGYNALAKNSITKNPEYKNYTQNLEGLNEQYIEARREGDEKKSHEIYLKIEKNEQKLANSKKYIKGCEETISDLLPWMAVTGACTIFSGVVLSAYVIHRKRVERFDNIDDSAETVETETETDVENKTENE